MFHHGKVDKGTGFSYIRQSLELATSNKETTMAVTARARTSRAVNLDTADLTDAEREQAMQAKLIEIRKHAIAESAARSKKEKLTKELEADMTAAKKRKISAIFDGKRILGEISNGKPTNVINVVTLFSKITRDQFLSVVTASGGKVKELFGTHIANACLEEKQGEYKLRVEVE
jgi:ribosomal protein S8E